MSARGGGFQHSRGRGGGGFRGGRGRGGGGNFWQRQQNQPQNQAAIEPGKTVGYLFTCDSAHNERYAVREAYNLLNRAVDKWFGGSDSATSATDGKQNQNGKPAAGGDEEQKPTDVVEEEEEEDIADALKRECQQGDGTAGPASTGQQQRRRFQQLPTKAKAFFFVESIGDEDHCRLARLVCEEMQRDKLPAGRHIQRIIPVELVGKVWLESLRTSLETLLKKHFSNDAGYSYAVAFKSRQCDLKKELVFDLVGDIVKALSPTSRVDLDSAQKTVVVEALRGLVFLSVLDDYQSLRRYSLHPPPPPGEEGGGGGEKVKQEEEEEEAEDGVVGEEEDEQAAGEKKKVKVYDGEEKN